MLLYSDCFACCALTPDSYSFPRGSCAPVIAEAGGNTKGGANGPSLAHRCCGGQVRKVPWARRVPSAETQLHFSFGAPRLQLKRCRLPSRYPRLTPFDGPANLLGKRRSRQAIGATAVWLRVSQESPPSPTPPALGMNMPRGLLCFRSGLNASALMRAPLLL